MLIELTHETVFSYSTTVIESAVELRLAVSTDEHQIVRSHAIDIHPRAKQFSYVDYFGNTVHFFTAATRHQRLSVVNKAVVNTSNRLPIGSAMPRLELSQGRVPLYDFLQFGGPIVHHAELTAISQRFRDDRDDYTRLRSLTTFLRDRIDYEPLVTRVDSGLDEVLELGKGVCQDFAHLMIGVCREIEVPARYVSGYLYTGASDDMRGSGATHAWCECFLPDRGWVGFDPTNDLLVDDRYVIIARGRDYRDVPPTKGVYRGAAKESIAVSVHTKQLDS